MGSPTLPDISGVSSLPDESLTTVLDLLFEPNLDLHALALPTMRSITFPSYTDLIEAIHDELVKTQGGAQTDLAARKMLLSILGSHPRLGEKKVHSAQSTAEQAQLRTDEDGGEAQQLTELNVEYEETFPGLRYVVFVNGRPREVIMGNMKQRIARGNVALEETEAIQVNILLLPGFLVYSTSLTLLSRPWSTSLKIGQQNCSLRSPRLLETQINKAPESIPPARFRVRRGPSPVSNRKDQEAGFRMEVATGLHTIASLTGKIQTQPGEPET